MNVSLDAEIKSNFEAIPCQQTLGATQTCHGITITPLSIRVNFPGRLGTGTKILVGTMPAAVHDMKTIQILGHMPTCLIAERNQ